MRKAENNISTYLILACQFCVNRDFVKQSSDSITLAALKDIRRCIRKTLSSSLARTASSACRKYFWGKVLHAVMFGNGTMRVATEIVQQFHFEYFVSEENVSNGKRCKEQYVRLRDRNGEWYPPRCGDPAKDYTRFGKFDYRRRELL